MASVFWRPWKGISGGLEPTSVTTWYSRWKGDKSSVRMSLLFSITFLYRESSNKAKLQKEGIFFLIHLFARDILLMKKLKIEETKTATYYSTFKTDIMKMGLVFLISNFFINKSSLANKLMSSRCSNSALPKNLMSYVNALAFSNYNFWNSIVTISIYFEP